MNYKVEIESGGRGGDVFYLEGGKRLPFWWEFTSSGAAIDAPSSEAWNAYCQKHSTEWATGQREEILERVAVEVQKQQAPTATFIINEQGIRFEF